MRVAEQHFSKYRERNSKTRPFGKVIAMEHNNKHYCVPSFSRQNASYRMPDLDSTPSDGYFQGCRLIVHFPAEADEATVRTAGSILLEKLPGIGLEWRRGHYWMPMSVSVPPAHSVSEATIQRIPGGEKESIGPQAILGIALTALRDFH